jgi:hypothetical protein
MSSQNTEKVPRTLPTYWKGTSSVSNEELRNLIYTASNRLNVSGIRRHWPRNRDRDYKDFKFKQSHSATPDQAWRTLEGFFTTPQGNVPNTYRVFQRRDPNSSLALTISAEVPLKEGRNKAYFFKASVTEVF